MDVLRSLSPLVEPLSLDEAFVDLAAAGAARPRRWRRSTAFAEELRDRVARGHRRADRVGRASAASKFIAKVASDLDKPDGLVVVRARHRAGPAPADARHRDPRRRAGHRRAAAPGRHHTVADLERVSEDELVRLLGKAHGHGLHALPAPRTTARSSARARDEVGQRRGHLRHRPHRPPADGGLVTRQAAEVAERLRKNGLSGRTVTIKVRLHDFTTLNRSTTLAAPTDDEADDRPARPRAARGARHHRRRPPARRRRLRAGRLDPGGPVRNEDEAADDEAAGAGTPGSSTPDQPVPVPGAPTRPVVRPGMDVVHDEHGRGWVWGAGRGVVTVRFETAETPPGPVRSLPADDPALARWLARKNR